MTKEEAKSCICTIETLRRLAYNIHGVMDAVDADNCEKIIKALEQEPKTGHWIRQDNTKEPLYGWYFCSECNSVIGDKPKFCSNCGARMEDKE